MNFPDVPFDESLFEANDMMKSYWERSTENRSDNFVRDVRTEEHDLPEELRELRQMTLDSFTERPSTEEPVVVGVPAKASMDALVTEKSVNGYTVVLWLVLAALIVFVVVSQMHHHYRSRSSSHSSSHRRT